MPSARPRSGFRRLLVAGAGALVLATLVVLLVRGDGNGDPTEAGPDPAPAELPRAVVERTGSEPLADDEPPLEPVGAPEEYRIVYRVREVTGGTSDPRVTESTEEHWVRRPFESRREVRREGVAQSEQEGGLGYLALDTGELTVVAVAPSVAPDDLRIGPALADAVDQGLVEVREQRTVQGTPCQVYRVGDPVAGGTLRPVVTDDEHVDVCFDARGLLLEEHWVLGGRSFRQRLAVEIDVGPVADDAIGRLPRERTVPYDQGGGSVRPVDPASGPEGLQYTLDAVPAGFEPTGRFAVVPPQPEAFSDPGRREEIIAGTVDVWVRGPDVLIVDQGGTLGGRRAFVEANGLPTVELAELGTAEVHLGLRGNELRVTLDRGRFVRIIGTLTVDELAEVGRSLRATEGTGLVYLDEDA